MGFAGTVLGMLVFGYLSDKIGRKFGMIAATVRITDVLFSSSTANFSFFFQLIVAVFTALAAGAYSGGNITGMLNALIAYRFLTGIGIGGKFSLKPKLNCFRC